MKTFDTLPRRILLFVILLLAFITFKVAVGDKAFAAYESGRLVDDSVFLDAQSMTTTDIQNFFASKGAGLANMNFILDCDLAGNQAKQIYQSLGAPCGQQVPASHIIYYAGQVYGISPRVILATMQKEQSVATAANPTSWQINQAMGYACPTSGSCEGGSNFFYQIDNGTWVLRYHYERARGNNNWWSPSSSWVCGSAKPSYYTPNLYPGQNVNFIDPYSGVQYATVYIQNAATSAFYCYTPHVFNNHNNSPHPNEPKGSTRCYSWLPAAGDRGRCYTGSYNFVYYFELWFGTTTGEPLISYSSHLSSFGWTGLSKNYGMTGTTGQNRPMEAFKINGEVEYSSYNFTTGWQPTVNRGMISGTTGMNRKIQAIKINPTGSLATNYDLYYRTHVSGIGWMGWAKNGEPSGVTGDSAKNIEAFEILLVSKPSYPPGDTQNPYQNFGVVSYNPSISLNVTSHVGNVGWQPTVIDTMVTGTTEQAKQIEAMKLSLANNRGLDGSIVYSAHVAGIGWQDLKSDNEIAGTIGQSKRMEAVRISLTGQLADNYDIWYRAHVGNIGWLGWAKNYAPVGSVGASRQLEAVETRIVTKNSLSFPNQESLYNPTGQPIPDSYSLNYSAHISNIGWINNYQQNVIAGTTGQSKPLEAIKLVSSSSLFGNVSISCSTYVKSSGWMNNITPGNVCGTAGQSKSLESIKLALSGTAANKYDIYYKVHLSQVGWQDWVKNNEEAGTPSSNKPIEAIIIKLVQK